METLTPTHHMPLSTAYLCENCQNIGNSAEVCPACADATALVNLAGVLNRDSAPLSNVKFGVISLTN